MRFPRALHVRLRFPESVARVVRTGRFLRHFARQGRFPFLAPDRILREQAMRLERMVRFAHREVPFYRDAMRAAGLTPRDIRTVDDLAALPVVEGTAIQELGHALLPGGRPAPEWARLRSGGSTGAPKTVYVDVPALIAGIAERERGRIAAVRAIGRRTAFREAMFAPPEGMHRNVERRMYELLWAPRPVRVERRWYSLYENPGKMLPDLAEFGAEHYHGYGSHIGRFFQHVLETGARLPLPRAVTYGSDEMPEGIRRAVTEQLGIPVFSHYGAVEALNIGFSCGEGEGLHLNVDLYPLRVVGPDGRALPDGEPGSVILSNLQSRGTVLLNYRIGDRGRILAEPCPCGRNLPRLAGLEGRDDEWIAREGGARLHAQALRTLFTHEDERVWRYQVVQEEEDRFRCTIVPATGVDRSVLAADVTELFRRRFGRRTVVELDFVSRIEPTDGGKVRPFRSRVGREAAAR